MSAWHARHRCREAGCRKIAQPGREQCIAHLRWARAGAAERATLADVRLAVPGSHDIRLTIEADGNVGLITARCMKCGELVKPALVGNVLEVEHFCRRRVEALAAAGPR